MYLLVMVKLYISTIMQAIQYDKGDNSWQILTNSGNVIVGFF